MGRSLNPLKRVNSILTLIDLVNFQVEMSGLNPLKRVNSILTLTELRKTQLTTLSVSIPSSGSIQFLQRRFQVTVEQRVGRAKKTVMVKRWLRGWGAYFLTLFN